MMAFAILTSVNFLLFWHVFNSAKKTIKGGEFATPLFSWNEKEK